MYLATTSISLAMGYAEYTEEGYLLAISSIEILIWIYKNLNEE